MPIRLSRKDIINDLKRQKHSQYSPSASGSWLKCVGKLEMERNIPKEKENYDYDYLLSQTWFEGSVAHYLAEIILLNNVSVEPNILLHPNINTILEKVNEYIEFVYSFSIDSFEIEAFLEHENGLIFGTTDVIIVKDDTLYIIDFKYGKRDVNVIKNSQLLTYAYLAKNRYTYKEIQLIIYQPNVKNVIKTYNPSIEEVENHGKKILSAIEKDQNLETKQQLLQLLNPGKDQCKWCRAKTICKPYSKYIYSLAGFDFYEFDKDIMLTKDEKQRIALNSLEIRKFIESINEELKHDMMNGTIYSEIKLAKGNRKVSWIDDKKAKEFLGNTSLESHEYFSVKLKTPLQVKKVLGEQEKIIDSIILEQHQDPTIVSKNSNKEDYDPHISAKGDFK